MSKAKKIISMLLAVAMVLTVAPVSVLASAADPTYTYGQLDFSKTDFSVDTSATTEVIRVAAGASSFSLGTTIVPATPAGIPQNSGTYTAAAYAGSTPETPTVRFTIKGVQPDETPTISSSLGSNCTFAAVQVSSSGDSYTYSWAISSGTASAGTDVVFTITYKVKGVTYTAYAYSHVENILVMNGWANYKRRKKNWIDGSTMSRHSLIAQYQSKNMYSAMCTDKTVSNRVIGYVNYALSGMTGDTLSGAGNSDDVDSSSVAYLSAAPNGNIGGEEQGALIKGRFQTTDSRNNVCNDNDSNRGESTIYIDKRNETLESLGFKVTMQVASTADFSRAHQRGIYVFNYKKTFGSEESNDGFNGDAVSYADDNHRGVSSSSVIQPNLNAAEVTTLGGFSASTFTGTGPDLTTTTDFYNYSVVLDCVSQNDSKSSYKNYVCGGTNINFKVYNTTDLFRVCSGIMQGTNTTYNTQYLNYISGGTNTSVTFNKGANPQARMYTGGWSNFLTAFQNACKLLVKPDTNQTEINNATISLINAYNGLTGYNANVTYNVKHMITGTTTEIIPAQTGTKPSGTSMVAKAATIEGYAVSGDSIKSIALTGENASETITFYYDPQSYNVIVNTNNENGDSDIIPTLYGTTVDISTLEYGTKTNYTFDGWYYDNNVWSQPVSNFEMPSRTVTIYGKWVTTPIKIYCDTQIDGQALIELGQVTPSEDGAVTFDRPADLNVEGYLFVEYYADSALTQLVNWPLSFNIGDPDVTVYARLVDVNGKIIFESNGGTAVPDITFSAPATVNAPAAPTRSGYTFTGWYFDRELTRPVTWPQTMSNNTGFIAYAGWRAEDRTISFNLGTISSNFDTQSIPAITGKADSPIPEENIPPVPKKFGYVFDHWNLDGKRYTFNKYPTENITLDAVWRATEYSAFIGIDSYEKLSGQYVETSSAQTGDVVTFRMTSLTNFYTGSSVFVFMYDSNFFELVNTDSAAFVLNSENEYVSGINAKIQGVTNDASLPWPDGLDHTNYKAMMITIDPTVTADNYNTEPMSDGKWLVEFQLRVKDTATGSGKVYMDNAWTRTPDNVMGTMFYGWSETSSNVWDTYNNVVVPELDNAYAIITLDETVTPDTTVILNAGAGIKGTAGTFADGTSEKTYTGRAETEIIGYVPPTLEGYTLTGWVKSDDASASWIEGYYPTVELNNSTYIAQWTPVEYPVNFYTDIDGTTLHHSVNVGYELDITEPPTAPTKVGYVFAGWVDADENPVTLPASCPLGGTNLYASWAPATDTKYVIRAVYTNPVTGAEGQARTTMTGTTGATVMIVDTVPSNPADNTIYIAVADLPTVLGGNYVYDPANNTLPITGVIAADGSTVIDVHYVGKTVTLTYNANGGTFADGTDTYTEVGTYNILISGPDANPTKEGYDFAGWNPAITFGTTRMQRDTTYTAKWTAKNYAATFNANGGYFDGDESITEKTVDVAYGSAVTAPSSSPAKLGYTFLGWASTPGASAAEALGTMDSTSGKTYYAVYALTDYTVTYYVDGVETYVDTYHMNDQVTIRAAETKTGYTFSGWKIGDADAADFTMGTADVTVEGTFTANYYDVIFDATGGFFDGDTSVTTKAVSTAFDSAIVAPSNPARRGYEFIGWADSETSTTPVTSFGNLTTTETVTYYALWNATEAEYTVKIYYQDTTGAYPAAASSSETLVGMVDSTVSYTPAEVTGFTLDSGNSVLSGTVSAETPLVLTVKYVRNQYTLTTDVDGVQTQAGTYYYEAAVIAPEEPTKTGYTFAGWTPAVPSTMPASNTVITATWTVNQYNVKFYKDNTKAEVLYDQNIDYGSSIVPPADPDKTGYSFLGWSLDGTTVVTDLGTVPANDVEFVALWSVKEYDLVYRSYNGVYQQYKVAYGTAKADMPVPEDPTREGWTFTGWSPALPDTMPANNVNTMAQWKINQYTITFDTDGGSEIAPITQDYATDVEAPADPTKTGYTFDGWDKEIPATMPAENVTIKAKWTINQYTITFGNTGDSVIAPITQDYGTAITAPEDPTKEGYTFAGWVDGNGDPTTVPATMPAESITINAKWTINQYTITFDTDGGSAVSPITQDYASVITAPENPTKTGYTFAGWSPAVPSTMPAENVTVKAQWTINQYTITFNTDGGSAVSPITQDYASVITAPENPTKTGYTFAGWSPAVPATMPAGDMTVTAQWTINEYTITFDTDGGSTVNPIAQDYGTAITAPEDPTKTGYTFAGWDKEIPATMPAENVTIKAKWTINQYTITFNTDGGTEVAPITQDYATDVTAPANPTKTGYTFDGWDKEIPATMPAENVTITAKWKINQYTITFNTDGGTEVAPITQNYATDVTAPANPTKTGYTFNGWDKEIPATMPAENVTITAKWTINQYKVTFLDAEGGVFSESTLDYGTPIAAPADSPAKEFYNFEGWSLDGATVVTDLGTVPADNVTITPIYTRVEVTLTIVGGSTTVIDKSNATPPVTGYIYGLETRLTQAKLLDQYIDVVGDGRLVVTPTKYKVCGTGTKVEVIDNVTDTVVETYYIIIFGDINGDASIDASDTSMLGSEAVGITNWSSDAVDSEGKTNYDYCKVLAGDTNKDGVINATDKSNLTDVTLYLAEYDQQTGVITPYAG